MDTGEALEAHTLITLVPPSNRYKSKVICGKCVVECDVKNHGFHLRFLGDLIWVVPRHCHLDHHMMSLEISPSPSYAR
ncbi:hypothetical protein BVRB_2g037150 [Beta vulgaris subsp. vulgaris]|nr:hypothetical protein BVRB_2g037150 [Beta vulgaris subsp. vulgaris]